MPNGFGYNPMFAGPMAYPTYGYMPGMMGGPWGMGYPYGTGGAMGFPYGFQPSYGPWFGGPMTWGGTFPGMYGGWAYTEGWPSDEQIQEMIYDSIDADPVVPYDSDITVEVTGGVVTLSGTVPNKRVKHAVGDDAWWVPGVWDVNNNLQIVGRRERAAPAPGRPEAAAQKESKKK